MNREAIDRVLGVVCQEMGCESARLEIGGPPPDAAEILCTQTPSGFRLVAVFREPPLDRASANLRLRQLAASFFDSGLAPPSVRPDAEQQLSQRRLDDELYALAGRTGSAGALVFDLKSPIIWGCSEGRSPDEDLESWVHAAELEQLAQAQNVDLGIISGLVESDRSAALEAFRGDTKSQMERLVAHLSGRTLRTRRAYLLRARAVREVRDFAREQESSSAGVRRLVHGPDLAYFARSIAGIYVVLLHFPATFSELHVEGMALHALPVLERLVLSLPAVDPPPSGGGKVVQLPVR